MVVVVVVVVVTRISQYVSKVFALSECGRYSVSYDYMTKCAMYLLKLTEMPELLRQLDEAWRSTGVTFMKQLCRR